MLWRTIYSALMWLAQPLLRRKLRRRAVQEPGYLTRVDERFGHYAYPALAPSARPRVWLHAVSLGETRAAAVLVQALRQQCPELSLLLTHGTATGRAEGARLLQAGDTQCWLPWDTPGAVQRFLQHHQPSLGLLMETEVWPNLVHYCANRGVPLLLVNARLSDKSLRQARRLGPLARPAYRELTAVWAQTDADAQRLQALGAPVRGALGNLKFDATPSAPQVQRGRQWRSGLSRPVLMLAVSREGEELALLQALKQFMPPGQTNQAQNALSFVATQVQWLIVPRHPQRFDAVAELIVAQGFAIARRSQWPDTGPPPFEPAQAPAPCIWLGDSLGEMPLYYALADVALLGGSFAPLGGQNLIEAAACGCPVIMGPSTFNFAQAAEQALSAGAARRVADLADGLQAAWQLLQDTPALAQSRQASLHFAQAHRGAALRLAQVVAGQLHQMPR